MHDNQPEKCYKRGCLLQPLTYCKLSAMQKNMPAENIWVNWWVINKLKKSSSLELTLTFAKNVRNAQGMVSLESKVSNKKEIPNPRLMSPTIGSNPSKWMACLKNHLLEYQSHCKQTQTDSVHARPRDRVPYCAGIGAKHKECETHPCYKQCYQP